MSWAASRWDYSFFLIIHRSLLMQDLQIMLNRSHALRQVMPCAKNVCTGDHNIVATNAAPYVPIVAGQVISSIALDLLPGASFWKLLYVPDSCVYARFAIGLCRASIKTFTNDQGKKRAGEVKGGVNDCG